jgi:hypothetical protein
MQARKQSVHVVVTADDIGQGNRCDPWSCPIARALWRATGAKWAVYGGSAYRIGEGKGTARYCYRILHRAS